MYIDNKVGVGCLIEWPALTLVKVCSLNQLNVSLNSDDYIALLQGHLHPFIDHVNTRQRWFFSNSIMHSVHPTKVAQNWCKEHRRDFDGWCVKCSIETSLPTIVPRRSFLLAFNHDPKMSRDRSLIKNKNKTKNGKRMGTKREACDT